ncbi:MAG: carbamate kinase [Mycoplasmoidaceae bacterium]|nr:carbamate kinase [Mycoplasmoidaceae bacterium]
MSTIVIALGGNALGDTPAEQIIKIQEPAKIITKLIKEGHDVIVGHGNGPQVGAIFNAFNIAHNIDEKIPAMPFAEAGAMSQGYIGLHINNALCNELIRSGITKKEVIYFLTQTIVDKNDPAFKKPTKPVGAFYKTQEEAIQHNPLGSTIIHVPNKGYRRVVPSPKPISLLNLEGVQAAVKQHKVVICGGGGGIPTIVEDNRYKFVDGVIDKDYVAAMIADHIDADYLVILTNVPNAFINYGTDKEQSIKDVTVKQMQKYIDTKEFAAGSMLPKVQAAMEFVEKGKNRKAIIACLSDLPDAIKGKCGTIITK